MKHKYTYKDKIALYLANMKGEWVESYKLTKTETPYGWLGISGDREARRLAERGFHIVKGVKYHIERQRGKEYAEFRCTSGQKKNTRWVEVEVNGEIKMRKIEELVNV